MALLRTDIYPYRVAVYAGTRTSLTVAPESLGDVVPVRGRVAGADVAPFHDAPVVAAVQRVYLVELRGSKDNCDPHLVLCALDRVCALEARGLVGMENAGGLSLSILVGSPVQAGHVRCMTVAHIEARGVVRLIDFPAAWPGQYRRAVMLARMLGANGLAGDRVRDGGRSRRVV